MNLIIKRKVKWLLLTLVILQVLFIFGVFTHLFEKNFDNHFHYPYEGSIEEFIFKMRQNETPAVPPINTYNFKYLRKPDYNCEQNMNLRLIFLIKSAPGNLLNRNAIRSSWGYEKRFSDVEIKRFFLLGIPKTNALQEKIDKEAENYNDIIQSNFTDSYYNNTYKTMSGFTFASLYCKNSRYYMFVDDDYYVSVKNVLRFVRYPPGYPEYLMQDPKHNLNMLQRKSLSIDFDLDDSVRLYSGYVFDSAPLRHFVSKWYVSLDEYPYDKWPPYVTAGAYILSREALLDMYYASFYTKHFRFDDIYVGLLAYKTKIKPFHSTEFYFNKLPYYRHNYHYVVASHGYDDYNELLRIWTDQKSLGYA